MGCKGNTKRKKKKQNKNNKKKRKKKRKEKKKQKKIVSFYLLKERKNNLIQQLITTIPAIPATLKSTNHKLLPLPQPPHHPHSPLKKKNLPKRIISCPPCLNTFLCKIGSNAASIVSPTFSIKTHLPNLTPFSIVRIKFLLLCFTTL